MALFSEYYILATWQLVETRLNVSMDLDQLLRDYPATQIENYWLLDLDTQVTFETIKMNDEKWIKINTVSLKFTYNDDEFSVWLVANWWKWEMQPVPFLSTHPVLWCGNSDIWKLSRFHQSSCSAQRKRDMWHHWVSHRNHPTDGTI